jgi:hypothetical protein
MIKCKTCLVSKPIAEFAKCRRCKRGVRGDCKKCHSKKSIINQKKNKVKRKEYLKKWHQENKEKVKQNRENYKDIKNKKRRDKYANDEEYRNKRKLEARKWQQDNPKKRKNHRLKQYGITYEDFIELLDKAEHKCQICGYSDKSDKKMFPVVDHCHNTNIVRGILCSKCNMALGNFNDSIDNLKNAILYLKK